MDKKKKIKVLPEIKCPKCGLLCYDEVSLKRHMDWVHKETGGVLENKG